MIALSKLNGHVSGFRSWMQNKGYCKPALKRYVRQMENILVANPWADTFTYQQVLEYMEQLSRKRIGLATKKYVLIVLKKYYDYLLDTGKREDHPCRGLHMKGTIDKSIIHSDLFTLQELEPLVDFQTRSQRLRACYQVMVSLLVYQALTPTEVARLKTKHINLDEGTIYIPGGQLLTSRTLELHPKQFNILSGYLKDYRKQIFKPENDHLLFNLRGTELKEESVYTHVETFRYLFAGRYLSAKIIRNSVISHWVNERKIPLDQVQLMAGHRWISSTERYIKNADLEDREMLKLVHPMG